MRMFRLTLLFLFAILFAVPTLAQEEPVTEPQRPVANQDPRTNMLRQLGLNREQIQRLQRINRERKPLMDAAQEKLRNANRSLDEAIYADEVIESDVQTRLKDLQLAQAEVFKIRFTSELAIRRLLTPEQLVRFRNMRQRFERARKEAEERRSVIRDNQQLNIQPRDVQAPAKILAKPVELL